MTARVYSRSATRETLGWQSAPAVGVRRPRRRLTTAVVVSFLLGLLIGIAL